MSREKKTKVIHKTSRIRPILPQNKSTTGTTKKVTKKRHPNSLKNLRPLRKGEARTYRIMSKAGKVKSKIKLLNPRIYCNNKCPLWNECPLKMFTVYDKKVKKRRCLYKEDNAVKKTINDILKRGRVGLEEALKSKLIKLTMAIESKHPSNIQHQRRSMQDMINFGKYVYGDKQNIEINQKIPLDQAESIFSNYMKTQKKTKKK